MNLSWTNSGNIATSLIHGSFFFKTGIKLHYNVVIGSVVQQNESAICVHIAPPS